MSDQRGNTVVEILNAACTCGIPIHHIKAFRRHMVPRGGFAAVQDDIANRAGKLALIHLPVPFRVESHLQEPVLGIVPLAAARTNQITAPGRALMIVILGHRERCPATAGHKKHPQRLLNRTLFGLALTVHDSSTVANDFFLR